MRLDARVWLMACVIVGCADSNASEGTTDAQTASGTSQGASTTEGETDSTGDEPSTSSTGGDTMSAETGATGGDPSGSWCDLADDACGGAEFEMFECDSPMICAGLIGDDPALSGEEGPVAFANPEAATCILEALRADTRATHRIAMGVGGENDDVWRIEPLGDGTIIVTRSSQHDKCASYASTWAMRRDDAFFDACLELTDDDARYACLIDPVDPAACVEAPAECP